MKSSMHLRRMLTALSMMPTYRGQFHHRNDIEKAYWEAERDIASNIDLIMIELMKKMKESING